MWFLRLHAGMIQGKIGKRSQLHAWRECLDGRACVRRQLAECEIAHHLRFLHMGFHRSPCVIHESTI